jgi:hypothetical protein
MLTKEQIRHKRSNRCKHINAAGEQLCVKNGNYSICHDNGKLAEPAANKRCYAHKLPGQRSRGNTIRIFKKQNQPRKIKKKLKRKRPSNAQMLTKEKIRKKEDNRCKHINAAGEQLCVKTGDYSICHDNGTIAEPAANKRCSAHKLRGQRNRGNTSMTFKKQNSGAPTNKNGVSRKSGNSRSNPPGHVIDNIQVIKKEVSER